MSLAGRRTGTVDTPPVELIPFLLAVSLLVNEVWPEKKKKCVCDGVLASLPLGTFSSIHKVARPTKA